MVKTTVEAGYDESPNYEWDRLDRHRTEFAVTLRAMAEYMPKTPATVLDVGGGPGRYAIVLAERKHTVTLMDLSRASLDLAKDKVRQAGVSLTGYIHGDARDLSALADNSFDVVLLMGPLYHLQTYEDRRRALFESVRVLKPSGVMFAAFIGRYAGVLYAAKFQPEWILTDRERCEYLLRTGLHHQRAQSGTFPDAYFAHPSEIVPFMEQGGLKTLDLIGCEGVVNTTEDTVNNLAGEAWDAWVDMNYRLGKDPCLHGASNHLLYVGRKVRQ